jgi:hypothetical protein
MPLPATQRRNSRSPAGELHAVPQVSWRTAATPASLRRPWVRMPRWQHERAGVHAQTPCSKSERLQLAGRRRRLTIIRRAGYTGVGATRLGVLVENVPGGKGRYLTRRHTGRWHRCVVQAARHCPKRRPQLFDLGGRAHCVPARNQRMRGWALEGRAQACGVVRDLFVCKSSVRSLAGICCKLGVAVCVSNRDTNNFNHGVISFPIEDWAIPRFIPKRHDHWPVRSWQ